MQKNYDHTSENKLYADWKQSGKMQANNQSQKKAFTIPLPPPNVTGQLHLGHAAMLAIEDIMIRFKKMTNHEVLWIPGTDHAAIATENVVLKHLGAKSREEYSREEFLEHCRVFAQEKHDTITHQMEKMGAWLDWSREAYTFDEERNYAVNTIFKRLYEDGLIERGYRMINWSVGAQSVLADDELEWEEGTAPFYYIRCGEFVIGTVRSETKCADSPLMLHPEAIYVKITNSKGTETFIISEYLWSDPERFNQIFSLIPDKHEDFKVVKTYKGKDLEGQIFEYDTYAGTRKFAVMCDAKVIDPKKGSGSMTISPSHSSDDYDLAKRLKLDDYFLEKIDFEGKMTAIAGECEGLEVEKARKVSAKIMKEKGLLVGVEKNYKNRVPICYRSGCVVEPMISPQWFISVNKVFTDRFTGEQTTLKKQMQEAVRGGHVKIIPKKFEKEYFRWIDNLQDWCISRQIWWGHRIPVWYDKDHNIVATGPQKKEDVDPTWQQDEDTLDTWFSSALWPFSTLGWPDEKNKDFEKFYPNDVLETGWDIIFFWVARMIMFGKYATGRYPFHTVYLHGMVTDEHGKKMSKSKGNGIDPLDMIKDFGADPIRLALVIGSTPGQNIPIGENKIKGYRNFVNKLWNAGRFVQLTVNNGPLSINRSFDIKPESLAEKWILARFSKTAKLVKKDLEEYRISNAGDKIYHFVWDEFCDWFIEASKLKPNPEFLAGLYAEILKLTHPLCPFVTEQIWKDLLGKPQTANSLLLEEHFPDLDFQDKKSVAEFEKIQNLVNEIRSLRAENKLNPKEKLSMSVEPPLQDEARNLTERLAGVVFNDLEDDMAQKIITDDLEVLVQIPVDEARQQKEINSLKKEISALEGRLSNKKYIENAPEKLVNETKENLEKAKAKLAKII